MRADRRLRTGHPNSVLVVGWRSVDASYPVGLPGVPDLEVDQVEFVLDGWAALCRDASGGQDRPYGGATRSR